MEITSMERFMPTLHLGQYQSAIAIRLSKMEDSQFIPRFWSKDATLWNEPEDSPTIINSMGWINVMDKMKDKLPELERFAERVIKSGIKHVVLIGMGGSSLVSIVFKRILKNKNNIEFYILDTTDPVTIKQVESQIEIEKTIFIIASKSGTTTEALALFEYFYSKVEEWKGDEAGKSFIAITDPGTTLRILAKQRNFLNTFINFEDIGGRYSALSYFGILPWVLMGQNAQELLNNAQRMAKLCMPEVTIYQNPGVLLGAVLGELARLGRNKLTFVIPESFSVFGIWLEQLIAESTGKNGLGILPVITTQLGASKFYGEDRVFVFFDLLKEQNENTKDKLNYLSKLGHPLITIPVENQLDLGSEFFRWEVATATACSVLGINPFDQENVQKSKDITNKLLISINQNKQIPYEYPVLVEERLSFFTNKKAENSKVLIKDFLDKAKERDYIAIQAFISETKEVDNALKEMRKLLQEKLNIATTIGYGPRYLHSTGQYHKGGPNNGLFIQFTSKKQVDAEIPGKPYTFGQLITAQALGDFTALLDNNRRILRVDLGNDVLKGLEEFKFTIENSTNTIYYNAQSKKMEQVVMH